MTLPIPDLDDRSFDSLVSEGISLLPLHSPQWTNHNPSDPGITLIELLAYVCELLLFRLNQIGHESKLGFLRLLCGDAYDHALSEPLDGGGVDDATTAAVAALRRCTDPAARSGCVDDAIRALVAALARPQRAVTKQDFELLALSAAAGAYGGMARTHCAAGFRIEKTGSGVRIHQRPADFTVVIVPPGEASAGQNAEALKEIREKLLPACLLGSRVHVIDAVQVVISVSVTLRARVTRTADLWLRVAQSRLDQYFSPYAGIAPNASGWPFGRHVYLSDVVEALQEIEGVEGVDEVRMLQVSMSEHSVMRGEEVIGIQVGVASRLSMTTRFGAVLTLGKDRLIRADTGQLIGIALKPYELVKVVLRHDGLRVVAEARFAWRD